MGLKLCDVFNFHVLAFGSRGWIILYNRKQQLIQFRSSNPSLSVLIYLVRQFNSFVNTLFCDNRSKYDRNIRKRRYFFVDKLLKILVSVCFFLN